MGARRSSFSEKKKAYLWHTFPGEGAGLLGLPFAVRLCGWASLGCLLLVGTLAGFTGYLLAMCMHESKIESGAARVGDGRRVRDSYAKVGAACYGRRGEATVRVCPANHLS